jgi:hypothetical protein
MARLTMPRTRPLSRREWTSAITIAVAIVSYFIVLEVLDRRAATYFNEVRATDPDLYLDQLRAGQGFDAFLPEYASLKGFDTSVAKTPAFLMGRWSMRDAPLRLNPGERPRFCTDPIVFDYGIVIIDDATGEPIHVGYRITGGMVEVSTATGQSFEIDPVSYGSTIDYLKFVPPNRTAPVYAYLCAG